MTSKSQLIRKLFRSIFPPQLSENSLNVGENVLIGIFGNQARLLQRQEKSHKDCKKSHLMKISRRKSFHKNFANGDTNRQRIRWRRGKK